MGKKITWASEYPHQKWKSRCGYSAACS